MKKIINVLLLGLLMAPATGLAAVTVTVDDLPGKKLSDAVTIPVNVTGFADFTAGRLTLNTGTVCLENVKVEAGDGTLYPKGLADWSAETKTTETDAIVNWLTTKDAAVDYDQIPGNNKTRIYFYAPDKTTGTDGVLFNIKATLSSAAGCTAKSDNLTLGGALYTGAQHTDALADSVSDYAALKFAVDTTDITPKDVTAVATGATVKQDIVIPANGKTGNAFTFASSDDKVNVAVPAQTTITTADGSLYQGITKTPTVKVASTAEKANLPETWQKDTDMVLLDMGVSGTSLKFNKDLVVTIEVVRAANAPDFKVYYVPDSGATELAGKDGVSGGKTYAKGGTILTKTDSADKKTVTYSVGLLLDHMSQYDVGSVLPAASSDDGGSSSGCFIATAAFGSPMEPQVETLRDFRDQYLMTNAPGKAFVYTYYKLSPPMADFIAQHDTLRAMTRGALMPLIGVSSLMLATGMGWTGLGLCMLGLLGLMLTGSRLVRRN